MITVKRLKYLFCFLMLACFYLPLANAANATNSATPTPAASTSPAIAGQVVVSSGTVTAVNQSNQSRALERGSDFYTGDTLITADNSKLQVRFTDGTVVALNPDTTYKISDYHYQQAGQSDKSFTTLIQGGFRAITGLINKKDPSAYQIDTSVAAIAARGTNFGGSLDKGKLYVGVWKGNIVVTNAVGKILLGQGDNYDFALIDSANSAPIGLLQEPDQLAGHCIHAQAN